MNFLLPSHEKSSQIILEKKSKQPIATTISTSTYKSFEDLYKRTQQLKLPINWKYELHPEKVIFSKINPLYTIPEYELTIIQNFSFSIKVFAWHLPENHTLYVSTGKSVQNTTISNLIIDIDKLILCNGLQLFSHLALPHIILKTSTNSVSPISQKVYYRSSLCTVLIPSSESQCKNCLSVEKKRK